MKTISNGKLQKYVDEYNSRKVNINGCDVYGNSCAFTTAALRLPALISSIITSKQIGEEPAIYIGDNMIDDEDLMSMVYSEVFSLIAFGTVFCFPYDKGDGSIGMTIGNVKDFDNLRYVEVNDNLQYIEYNEKVERYDVVGNRVVVDTYQIVHWLDEEGWYNYRKSLNNVVVDSVENITQGYMLPFIVRTEVLSMEKGAPIWSIASENIITANKTKAEMLNQMELERSVVGIPMSWFSGGGAERIKNSDSMSIPFLSNDIRGFVVLPNMEGEREIRVGGNYNPTPYLESLNQELHQISMLVGLGARYLSYDKGGGLKTAKEVRFGENDLMLSQALINKSILNAIKMLVVRYVDMKSIIERGTSNLISTSDVYVEFSDAVVNSIDDTQEKLTNDYVSGAIDRDTYVRESYKFISNIDVSDSTSEVVEDLSESIVIEEQSVEDVPTVDE